MVVDTSGKNVQIVLSSEEVLVLIAKLAEATTNKHFLGGSSFHHACIKTFVDDEKIVNDPSAISFSIDDR